MTETCRCPAACPARLLQAPKPSPGPHKTRECLPLILLLRNRLKYALTGKEVTSILMQRLVEVDGKVRTDKTYPVGFMDVVDIPKTGEGSGAHRVCALCSGCCACVPAVHWHAAASEAPASGVRASMSVCGWSELRQCKQCAACQPGVACKAAVRLSSCWAHEREWHGMCLTGQWLFGSESAAGQTRVLRQWPRASGGQHLRSGRCSKQSAGLATGVERAALQ